MFKVTCWERACKIISWLFQHAARWFFIWVGSFRKAAMARKHHYLSQLRRHFSAWRDFVAQEQEKKALERAQETTRSKMMNLLTAVADGSLWSAREEDGGKKEEGRPRGRGGSARDAGKEKSRSGSGQSGAHNVKSELVRLWCGVPMITAVIIMIIIMSVGKKRSRSGSGFGEIIIIMSVGKERHRSRSGFGQSGAENTKSESAPPTPPPPHTHTHPAPPLQI